MPYLCAQSPHAHDAIARQATYDFVSKDDTQAALACAEATLSRDRGRIEEKCGYSSAAKWKAIGERIATSAMSYLSMGLTDIVATARGRTANEDLFGHANRQGEGGAATQHIDGVVGAIMTIKDITTEEACVRAIDMKDPIGYMNYCPISAPAQEPYEIGADGKPIKVVSLLPPIDPNADLSGKQWEHNFGTIDDSLPDQVFFDESRLPKFPDDLLQDIPRNLYPDEEHPDMVPPAWPIDLYENPTKPLTETKKPLEIQWNILDKPETIIVLGGFLLAILSI
jgi:hypothetical protein